MKRFPLTGLLILIFSLTWQIFAQTELKALYQNQQFFELRDKLQRREKEKPPSEPQDTEEPTSFDLLFYTGVVSNKFNRPSSSILMLRTFLDATKRKKSTELRAEAYKILSDDYVKTYQYAKAADCLKTLADEFKDSLDTDESKDFQNDFELYQALRDTPPQMISFDGNTRIAATRDKANLLNLPVEINSRKMDFVFDTGANLSTMTASTAARLNLKTIDANLDVGTTTKERVKSKLAVVPIMKIGNVTVRNVVFLVFDDPALFFPEADYQINGIIGFPVIEAMRQITLTRENLLTVPASPQKKSVFQNLALDGLSPLVQASYDNQKMTFILDTGAQTSALYPSFFSARKTEIVRDYRLAQSSIGGAGGKQQVNSYQLKNIRLDVGGRTAYFPQINLITDQINDQTKNFYGNLGQDLIRQFHSMTLDFEGMSLTFE